MEDLLLRKSGLPGPRPNLRFGMAAARALMKAGPAGYRIIDGFRSRDARQALVGTAYPFLPMVGVLALGITAGESDDPSQRALAREGMVEHADDARREVREATMQGLALALVERMGETLPTLGMWTEGYLQADAMLRALSQADVVKKLPGPGEALAALDQAYKLAAGAPRAHQRSQGYRALLRALSATSATLGKRYPAEVTQWLEERANTAVPDLRKVVTDAVSALRGAGMREGDAAAVHDALEASKPVPRDPRWDVGPTRERGKKANRRGRNRG